MSDEKNNKFGFAMMPNTDANYLIQKRNVDPIRKMLQESLSGVSYYEVKDEKTDKWQVVKREVGEKKLNDLGVQRVMMFFDMIINNQTVMGNIERGDLGQILFDSRKNLLNTLWVNAHKYELNMDHYHEVIGDIMNCMRLFLTRAIDNKERESDSQSVKVSEIHGAKPGKKSILGM